MASQKTLRKIHKAVSWSLTDQHSIKWRTDEKIVRFFRSQSHGDRPPVFGVEVKNKHAVVDLNASIDKKKDILLQDYIGLILVKIL